MKIFQRCHIGLFPLLCVLLLARPAASGEIYAGVARSDLGAGDTSGAVFGVSGVWEFADPFLSLVVSLEYIQKGGEIPVGFSTPALNREVYRGLGELNLGYLQLNICPQVQLFHYRNLSLKLFGGLGFGSLSRKSLELPAIMPSYVDDYPAGIKNCDVSTIAGGKISWGKFICALAIQNGLVELEGEPPLAGEVRLYNLVAKHNQVTSLTLGYCFEM